MMGFEIFTLIGWLCVFVLILLSQLILLYVAYFKLDELESAFNISDGVHVNRKIKSSGPTGRMYRLRHIRALTGGLNSHHLSDPGAFIASELLSDELMKWLSIPDSLLFAGTMSGALLWTFDQFQDVHIALENPMSDFQMIYAATWIALLILILMSLALTVFVGYFKLDEIESNFENSRFVAYHRRTRGHGFRARQYRLNHIRNLLYAPECFLLEIDPGSFNDLNDFPQHLERWVIIPYRMAAFSILGIVAVWGLGSYGWF